MIHKNRKYRIVEVASLLELAQKLAGGATWCSCNGFTCNTLTLLNDSFSADGAQEYAVIRNGRQIESLTCSWMSVEELHATLGRLDAHGAPSLGEGKPFEIKIHDPGVCGDCA